MDEQFRTDTPPTHHFTVDDLGNGIYAALARRDGWAAANSGIIDLGDRALIFDTGLSIEAAQELQRLALELTGHPVGMVVNSHFHDDHVWGNQVFDVDIVSTTVTRRLMDTAGRERYREQCDHAPLRLSVLLRRLEREKSPAAHADVLHRVRYYQGLVGMLTRLTVRLPNITFNDTLEIHGSRRKVKLVAPGVGHTPGDLVLHVEDAGVVFCGDLLAVEHHPYLPDSDPGEWTRILEFLRGLKAHTFVPGHGSVGSQEHVDEMVRYISTLVEQALNELALQIEDNSQLQEFLARLRIPQPFAHWAQSDYYTDNMHFFYRRLTDAFENPLNDISLR